jgi:hypothetical protein
VKSLPLSHDIEALTREFRVVQCAMGASFGFRHLESIESVVLKVCEGFLSFFFPIDRI